MKKFGITTCLAAMASFVIITSAVADDDEEELTSLTAKPVTVDGVTTQQGAKEEDGKWLLPDESVTYNVAIKDNQVKVDWYTYNGYRRYHDACHVCHGPDAMGSTFAPALKDSLKTMSYEDVIGVISSGRIREMSGGQSNVMPAFAEDPNVACFMDDIYAYLKARSDGALPRIKLGGRNRDQKPEAAREYQKECFGE